MTAAPRFADGTDTSAVVDALQEDLQFVRCRFQHGVLAVAFLVRALDGFAEGLAPEFGGGGEIGVLAIENECAQSAVVHEATSGGQEAAS